MPSITVRSIVDRAGVERLLRPRDDIVAERPVAPERGEAARFALAGGPFSRYERTVRVTSSDRRDGGSDGPVDVVEAIDFSLPRGTWRFLMHWPVRRALRHRRDDGKLPWWYPPQRPDARAATVLGLLATLSLVVGYHGTLLSRTMTFAADEFGAGSTAQGDALARRPHRRRARHRPRGAGRPPGPPPDPVASPCSPASPRRWPGRSRPTWRRWPARRP